MIGASVVGLITALELQRVGRRVIVIVPREPRTCRKLSSIARGTTTLLVKRSGLSPGLPGDSPTGSHARDIGVKEAANRFRKHKA